MNGPNVADIINSGGNVYADLGNTDAGEMQRKSQLPRRSPVPSRLAGGLKNKRSSVAADMLHLLQRYLQSISAPAAPVQQIMSLRVMCWWNSTSAPDLWLDFVDATYRSRRHR